MSRLSIFKVAPAALLASGVLAHSASAVTQPVTFNALNASTTLSTPFSGGDNLRLNTLVITEVGALTQSITFTVGAGVESFFGHAAWEVADAPGPRLVGVNIDLVDGGNNIVANDSFLGVLGGFAVSQLEGTLIPGGTYTLRATGLGQRDSSLDVTLSFIGAVPEPETYFLMLAGLGMIGFVLRRRR